MDGCAGRAEKPIGRPMLEVIVITNGEWKWNTQNMPICFGIFRFFLRRAKQYCAEAERNRNKVEEKRP